MRWNIEILSVNQYVNKSSYLWILSVSYPELLRELTDWPKSVCSCHAPVNPYIINLIFPTKKGRPNPQPPTPGSAYNYLTPQKSSGLKKAAVFTKCNRQMIQLNAHKSKIDTFQFTRNEGLSKSFCIYTIMTSPLF